MISARSLGLTLYQCEAGGAKQDRKIDYLSDLGRNRLPRVQSLAHDYQLMSGGDAKDHLGAAESCYESWQGKDE